jgi:hypothetical protein
MYLPNKKHDRLEGILWNTDWIPGVEWLQDIQNSMLDKEKSYMSMKFSIIFALK